jgi:hypothetical protein
MLKKPFHIHEPQAWAPTLHGQSTTYGPLVGRTLVFKGFFSTLLELVAGFGESPADKQERTTDCDVKKV